MEKEKKELREIPKKNYFIVLVVSILVVVLTLYVRSFYFSYVAYNSDSSIFVSKSINQINFDDIDYAVNETTDSVLFISYNGEKSISNMERKLYREIEKKNLNDRIIYLNVTDYLENNKYLEMLRSKYPSIAVDINKAPMFIFIKDGECVEVIDSSKELITYKTLNTLLSKYGIE